MHTECVRVIWIQNKIAAYAVAFKTTASYNHERRGDPNSYQPLT
jgi:hypothetical protein